MPPANKDTPGVIAPPPLIFLMGIVLGLALNWFFPLPFLPDIARWVVSMVLVLGGLAIGFSAFSTLRKANTPVDPYESPTAIVSGGPYGFTRNPIYLGFALITIGLACFANALWVIFVLPVVLIIVDRGVIAREERYLERKFGAAYTSYKARVRRWI
jgi:protein-S-isoprenylcysteine O-methyltransferase Ste14